MRPSSKCKPSIYRAAAALLVAAAALPACATDVAPAPSELILSERVTVTAAWVLFRDLLAVPVEAAPVELLDAAIAPSPLPGATCTIPAGLVRLRLRRAGADLIHWTISGPAQVEVFRPAPPAAPAATAATADALVEARTAETVRRGTELRIAVKCGALTIETTGRLMQDAVVGQVAPLQVEATRVIVTGRIIDPKNAEVLL